MNNRFKFFIFNDIVKLDKQSSIFLFRFLIFSVLNEFESYSLPTSFLFYILSFSFFSFTAFFEYVELTIVPFRNISRLSSYVRCTGNTCIISSSSSIFGTVGSGIRYVLTQAWNVIAVVLHIIGFPTDACCASLRRCFSPVTSAFESCCSSAPRPQLHTQTLLPMSVDMSGVRSSSAWGGGGPSEGRGHTLGGRGTTSTLTSLSNPAGGAKGGYAQLPSEV